MTPTLFDLPIWLGLLDQALSTTTQARAVPCVQSYLHSRLPDSPHTDWAPLMGYWTRTNEKQVAQSTQRFAREIPAEQRADVVTELVDLLHKTAKLRGDVSMKPARQTLDAWLDSACNPEVNVGDRRLFRDKALEQCEWAISDLTTSILATGVALDSLQVTRWAEQARLPCTHIPVREMIREICRQPPATRAGARAAIQELHAWLMEQHVESASAREKQQELLSCLLDASSVTQPTQSPT